MDDEQKRRVAEIAQGKFLICPYRGSPRVAAEDVYTRLAGGEVRIDVHCHHTADLGPAGKHPPGYGVAHLRPTYEQARRAGFG